ncbi:PEP-CTERM sorting domain-containing protein [Luteolibacter algae]|uniref:PEP-CTERM sorting domain-containing protein n=1 Tax=Luteolibacter algae TaxID=454151 RepID=A0ABW5D9J2_9BACT
MKYSSLLSVTVALCFSPVLNAQTFVVDFETDDTGAPLVAGAVDLQAKQPYANLFGGDKGLTITSGNSATNPLNLYNTEATGGADDDLERNSTGTGDWAGGSLTRDVLHNVLIINTNTDLTTPNDSGSGGEFGLEFDVDLISFGFDFVDLDRSESGAITFLDTNTGRSQTIQFTEFESGSGSVFEREGVLFGNRHANRVDEITATSLGLSSFDQITFTMKSSGGIGTLYGTTLVDSVPEPSSALLLLSGLTFLGFKRRR